MSPLQHIQGIAAAGLAALAMLPSTGASAGNLNFGPETAVRRLADVRLQNGTGEPLYLGQKLTFHWFGLPYAVSTGGYALGVRGKHDHYDIEKQRLIEWQGEGYVPNPLPEYRLTLADYALGYLAWLVGGLLALVYAGRAMLGRRLARRMPAKAAVAPAATATPAPLEPASVSLPVPSLVAPSSLAPASTPFASPAPPLARPGPSGAALVPERRAASNPSPAASAPPPREVTIVQVGPAIKTTPPAAAGVPAAPRAAPEVPAKRPEPKRIEPAAVTPAPVPPAQVTKVQPQPRPIEPQPAAKVRYRVKAVSAG